MACLSAGDHVLVPESIYGPSRAFAEQVLRRYGVEVEYYLPLEGPSVSKRIRDNTRLIWCESPGSITMEIQDVPAIITAHFDINYVPENQARTEALWETSENGGRAAYDGGRRVTFVARFCWSRGSVFSRGERVETRTLLCRGVEGQILSVSDMAIFRLLVAGHPFYGRFPHPDWPLKINIHRDRPLAHAAVLPRITVRNNLSQRSFIQSGAARGAQQFGVAD
jgi:Cys/Met metabolism PLP-dependent enzyme